MTEYMSGYGTAVHDAVRDAVRVMPDGRKVTAIPLACSAMPPSICFRRIAPE